MATPPTIESERSAAALDALRHACVLAIRSAGEYAPEVERGQAQGLIAELERLSRAAGERSSEDSRVENEVRRALAAYQRQAASQIAGMRKTREATQATLQEFSAGVSAGDATHYDGVAREIEALKAASWGDLNQVQAALRKACAGIRLSHAAFVRAQRIVMLQLQDEIRALREAIAQHQRDRERDPESGALRRESFEAEVRARLARRETTSLAVLTMHNLKALQAQHSREAILGLFEALRKRLASLAGPASPIGEDMVIARWSPNALALLLPVAGKRAEEIGDWVCAKLAGAYAVQTGGVAHRLVLDLTVTIVDPAVEFAAGQ